MLHVELSDREAGLLGEIIESYLTDLRGEIVATENKEWREDLKSREGMAKSLLHRLSAKQAAG
jgi:hypothetical protein